MKKILTQLHRNFLFLREYRKISPLIRGDVRGVSRLSAAQSQTPPCPSGRRAAPPFIRGGKNFKAKFARRALNLNIVIVGFLVWGMSVGTALAQPQISKEQAKEEFVKAGAAYRGANYQQAIDIYEDVLRKGMESGPLYYNLANSYFKQGTLGKAILNYERAVRLAPRDSDLQANFQYARSQVKNQETELSRSIWQKLWDLHEAFYTLDEMTMILFVLVLSAMTLNLLSLFLAWPKKYVRWGFMALAILFLIYGNGFLGKLENENHWYVVVAATPARFEPRDAATIHFELPEGGRIKVLKEEGPWLKIERPDGQEGWIPKTVAEKITKLG